MNSFFANHQTTQPFKPFRQSAVFLLTLLGDTISCLRHPQKAVTSPDRYEDEEKAPYSVMLQRRITVNREPRHVYRYWKRLDNLPRTVSFIKEVEATDNETSHWVARGQDGATVEWDATVIQDVPQKMIEWRSVSSSDVDAEGSVVLRGFDEGRRTEICVTFTFVIPFEKTEAGARIFAEVGNTDLENDLCNLKEQLEAGLHSLEDEGRGQTEN